MTPVLVPRNNARGIISIDESASRLETYLRLLLTLIVQVVGTIGVQEHAIGVILPFCQKTATLIFSSLHQQLRRFLFFSRAPIRALLLCCPSLLVVITHHEINGRTVVNLWPQRAAIITWYWCTCGHIRFDIGRRGGLHLHIEYCNGEQHKQWR